MKTLSKLQRCIYHIIAVLLIVSSLLFAIFRFPKVALRVVQALKDFGLSIAYYTTKTLNNIGWLDDGHIVQATVGEIPAGLEELLPFEWSEFTELFHLFVNRLFNGTYLKRYLNIAGNTIADISETLLLISLPLVFLVIIMVLIYSIENTDHNKDTFSLKIFKFIENKAWRPVKRWIVELITFIRNTWYLKILCLIWAWNFSVTTIFFEMFAWLFYFCVSIDFFSLYTQLVKLVADLSVPALFLPGWIWLLIGLKVFDSLRRDMGKAILRAKDAAVRAFLELYSWSILIVGKQRAKKSTLLALFKRLLERIFRDKAQEKFFQRDMQFPNFPWIYAELMIKRGQKRAFAKLEHCREFVKTLRQHFNNRYQYSQGQRKHILRHLRKKYGYQYADFIFEYDYKTYGLNYNNGATIVNLFDALEKYMMLFKIYQQRDPLDLSNISIREDIIWDDIGNFPRKDDDFYNRDPKDMKKNSKYSHRMNYDVFRPGKTFNPESPENNAVEYAIGVMDEADKERKNMLTKRGLKSSSDIANQENDLFETDTKMRPGHAALVDFYPFFRWVMASQRAGSLGADNRDMTMELYIKTVSDAKIALPCFAFEEALYVTSTWIFKGLYYLFRHARGDNTLLMYLLKKLYSGIFNHYWRVFNEFSYYIATVRVTDSQDGEVLEKAYKLGISSLVVYAEVFASDSYNGYYSAKARRSSIGLGQIPMYKGIRPTFEELQQQNSYFIEDISATFGVERRRAEQVEEMKEERKKAA